MASLDLVFFGRGYKTLESIVSIFRTLLLPRSLGCSGHYHPAAVDIGHLLFHLHGEISQLLNRIRAPKD